MTASQTIERARRLGVKLWPEGKKLRYCGHPSAIEQLLPELVADKPRIIDELRCRGESEAERLAVAIATQHFLAEGRFPIEPAPCAFHCGHTHERCRRCGAPFIEHC